MRRRALLSGLLAAACGKSRRRAPRLVWLDDVGRAYVEAARVGRPVLAMFAATWDCASKEYDHVTFLDPEVGWLLHEGFVCARIDCSDDEDPITVDVARRFDLKGIPTVITTDAAGRELFRFTEYVRPEKLAVFLRAARARHDAMRDIDVGLRLGAAWKRPVLLLFAPAWDHASEEIRRTCLGDRNVAGAIRDSFVLVDVACDDGANADWRRFSVRGSPAVIAYDAERRVELARLEQVVGPRVFERFLDGALAIHRG